MFWWISVQHPAYYQIAENCFFGFSTFSVTGDQKWKQTQKRHLNVRFARKSGPAPIRKGTRSVGIEVE